MKIKIGVVSGDKIASATELCKKMAAAVMAGRMAEVDRLSQSVEEIIDPIHSVSITESIWKRFTETIHEAKKDYDNAYLIDFKLLIEILKIVPAGEFHDILVVIRHAVEHGCPVLQLPVEEAGADV